MQLTFLEVSESEKYVDRIGPIVAASRLQEESGLLAGGCAFEKVYLRLLGMSHVVAHCSPKMPTMKSLTNDEA